MSETEPIPPTSSVTALRIPIIKKQKNLLKQQFETFTIGSREELDSAYERFQHILSMLELYDATVSLENLECNLSTLNCGFSCGALGNIVVSILACWGRDSVDLYDRMGVTYHSEYKCCVRPMHTSRSAAQVFLYATYWISHISLGSLLDRLGSSGVEFGRRFRLTPITALQAWERHSGRENAKNLEALLHTGAESTQGGKRGASERSHCCRRMREHQSGVAPFYVVPTGDSALLTSIQWRESGEGHRVREAYAIFGGMITDLCGAFVCQKKGRMTYLVRKIIAGSGLVYELSVSSERRRMVQVKLASGYYRIVTKYQSYPKSFINMPDEI
ncbi:hypothetical protein Tco_0151918 [Tanacetum coccineum]